MLPIYDLNTTDGREGLDARFAAMRGDFAVESKWASAAAGVLRDVRERGDEAVVEQMQRFTDPAFAADRIRVTDDELAAAEASLTGELREAIEAAIDNVERYQRHLLPRDPGRIELDGAELGLRWTPMPSAGLLAPGGSAVLFSSVIMLAVPALAAGVPAASWRWSARPRRARTDNPRATSRRSRSRCAACSASAGSTASAARRRWRGSPSAPRRSSR